MSNPQPVKVQSPSTTAAQSAGKFHPLPSSRLAWLLICQLLLAGGGALCAILGFNLWGVGLALAIALIACISLIQLTQQGHPASPLQQELRRYEAEVARLCAVNQSLSDQLVHQNQLSDQLQQAESAALQAEKMATLGMLVAGIAHEINTPLGAIQASAENLNHSAEMAFQQLPQLCRCLNGPQLAAFEQLLIWSTQNSSSRSSREERQLKREIKEKLQALKIDNAREISSLLSAMGIHQDLALLLPVLESPESNFILDAAYNLSAIQSNSQNIHVAAGRATNIVASLRNYVRKGSQAQPTLSDLREGLDTVLTLYQNKLKHGIEVHKHYEAVPKLLCYPEELDQAWANLIGNAIQAMDGKGQLHLSLTHSDNQLLLSITDSGPGIPQAVQDQIFAPYFTTKPMGQGSGLGLSITQKIISRHCGLIELDSRPGKTCFLVRLPLGISWQSAPGDRPTGAESMGFPTTNDAEAALQLATDTAGALGNSSS